MADALLKVRKLLLGSIVSDACCHVWWHVCLLFRVR